MMKQNKIKNVPTKLSKMRKKSEKNDSDKKKKIHLPHCFALRASVYMR